MPCNILSRKTAPQQTVPHYLINHSTASVQMRAYSDSSRRNLSEGLQASQRQPIDSHPSTVMTEEQLGGNDQATFTPLAANDPEQRQDPSARVPDPQREIQRIALQRAMRITTQQPRPRLPASNPDGSQERILVSRGKQLIPRDEDRIEQERLKREALYSQIAEPAKRRALMLYNGRLKRLRYVEMKEQEKEDLEQGIIPERAASLRTRVDEKALSTVSRADYAVLGELPSEEDLYQAFLIPFDENWKSGPAPHVGESSERKARLRVVRYLYGKFNPALDVLSSLCGEWRRMIYTSVVGLSAEETETMGKLEITKLKLARTVALVLKKRDAGLCRMRDDPMWDGIVEPSRLNKEQLAGFGLMDEEAEVWWYVRRKWRVHILEKNPLSATQSALMAYKRQASENVEAEREALGHFILDAEKSLRKYEDLAGEARKEIWMSCFGIREEGLRRKVNMDLTIYPEDVQKALQYREDCELGKVDVVEPSIEWLRLATERDEAGKLRLRQPSGFAHFDAVRMVLTGRIGKPPRSFARDEMKMVRRMQKTRDTLISYIDGKGTKKSRSSSHRSRRLKIPPQETISAANATIRRIDDPKVLCQLSTRDKLPTEVESNQLREQSHESVSTHEGKAQRTQKLSQSSRKRKNEYESELTDVVADLINIGGGSVSKPRRRQKALVTVAEPNSTIDEAALQSREHDRPTASQLSSPKTPTHPSRLIFSPSARLLAPLQHMSDPDKIDEDQEGKNLTHITSSGSAHMVDVSAKPLTKRTATAIGRVMFSNPDTCSLITTASLSKGDVLSVARIAGIQAAKLCPSIIPLCHPIMISSVGVELDTFEKGVSIEATVSCTGNTGVEMEALTAVMGAALTVVDMIKAVDKGARIEGVRVVMKEGGRSGRWVDEEWERGHRNGE